ncbi:hypothetical protein [Maritalea sp. S77]|uniref:hypothetical protein n=1 Tax=Maritalea sp. S77 TaxID=3415125 RepID=UPI003C7B6C69
MFKNISIAAALLFFTLSALMIFYPPLIYWLFALEPHELGDFLAKRAGVLFLGLGLLSFLTRDVRDKAIQRIISISFGSMMLLMAAMGIYEFARGYAGIGIWFANLTEIGFGAAYLMMWRRTKE